ncbi:Holliday junction branch migration DNA helicase RuvB [candidate division WOR-3 bacterium 4484_100]|uniref:Holliday junction branch migration complex subunit RuvB n=1 Tax=candidate division WOR-3 bacterium 4484_100 TaxID=1936077 RepID=A0A1V4QEW9_UNCW3|nr:MAG: Holliday junction branch migration DNA helicase RuvB [candidate division WOR-3 bacterium 4484_100]
MERMTTSQRLEGEEIYELTLRPKRLKEFVGQKGVVENLKVFIQAAKKRRESLEHILLFGPPGLGKTTLAHIIAREMGVNIYPTSGPILERPFDLAGILSNLNQGDILFIDEVHRINKAVEEYLYPALEDFALDVMQDKGIGAQVLRLKLNQFTLIGATTRSGLLTSPLRSRFGITFRLDYYPAKDLYKIIKRSSKILKIEITDQAAMEISSRARGTPRIANRLLRRVRDFAQVKEKAEIDLEICEYALERLEVDKRGLDDMDKRIIKTIIEKFNGGPVGIKSLAVAVGEDAQTIEEVFEPFLIMEGFIKRTPRGREATPLAYDHFKIKPRHGPLFDK